MTMCISCKNVYDQYIIDRNIQKNKVLNHLNEKYKINVDDYLIKDIITNKLYNLPCGYCNLTLKSLSENYNDDIEKLFMDIAKKNNIDYSYIYNQYNDIDDICEKKI
jgi:hypothetical protein